MSVELRMLSWSICLGILYVLIAATLSSAQRGLAWNVGNREGEVRPLFGPAGRAHRALRNYLETFVFFAAAVLAVMIAQRQSAHTALGAQLYFWGRLAYLPVYLIGVPYLRTLTWAVSLWGILMLLAALF